MKRPKTTTERTELKIARAAAPARDTLAVRALGGLSELADQPPLISLCAATFAAGLLARDTRLARAGGRMLAAELLATILKDAIKRRVDRTRPQVVLDGGDYEMTKGRRDAPEVNSFPSGHTAGAVAVARALARDYRAEAPLAYAVAGAVAALQVPRCRHYPSDIAAGAAIGLAAEGLVHLGERALTKAAS